MYFGSTAWKEAVLEVVRGLRVSDPLVAQMFELRERMMKRLLGKDDILIPQSPDSSDPRSNAYLGLRIAGPRRAQSPSR